MWKINGIDISERFGVYLKKGAYDKLLAFPSVKTYITEDVRDRDGETVLVQNVRKCARSVTIPCYLVANSQSDFWSKYDDFASFLTNATTIEFKIEKHNRTHIFIYEGCSDFSKLTTIAGQTKKYVEFTLSFREPNTDNVTKEDTLIAEDGQQILTEDGETINVNVNYYL